MIRGDGGRYYTLLVSGSRCSLPRMAALGTLGFACAPHGCRGHLPSSMLHTGREGYPDQGLSGGPNIRPEANHRSHEWSPFLGGLTAPYSQRLEVAMSGMNRIVQDRGTHLTLLGESTTTPKREGTPTTRDGNLETIKYRRGQGAFHRTTTAGQMERPVGVSRDVPESVRGRQFHSPAAVEPLDRHPGSVASSWRS